MKPNFALSLSYEGIGLLHRSFPGWKRVGEVGLDSPDLATELSALRETAEQIHGAAFHTKLIIPNDQIKYLSIANNALDDNERDELILAALEGATPYAVNELVYDWVLSGDAIKIATVARETLVEAEDFTVEHGFSPLSFVAIPESEDFAQEPFFGETRHAGTLLETGAHVVRDTAAIRVIGDVQLPNTADITAPQDVTDLPEGTETGPEVDAPDVAVETTVDAGQTVEIEDELHSDQNHAPLEDMGFLGDIIDDEIHDEIVSQTTIVEPELATSEPFAEEEDSGNQYDDTAYLEDKAEPHIEAEVAPISNVDNGEIALAFSTIRAHRDGPAPAGRSLDGVTRETQGFIAPNVPISNVDEFDQAQSAPEIEGTPEAYDHSYDSEYVAPFEPDENSFSADPEAQSEAIKSAPAWLKARSRDAAIAFFNRRSKAGNAAKEARADSISEAQSERQRMTVFGARKPEKTEHNVGGKPRYLGLVLTLVLLAFLAGVAAWASIFSTDGVAQLFGPRDTDAVITTLPDNAFDELTIEGEEAMVPSAPNDPDAPPPMTYAEAQARYAVTGIWQMAPQSPDVPQQIGLDGLYIASIDGAVAAYDAIALPDVAALQTDLRLGATATPAARGTAFAFDERGLIIATKTGALSPAGFVVYLGRPVNAPTSIPVRTPTVPDISDAQKRLASVRPKSRPGGLVEANERIALGGLTKSELAGMRPKARPPKLVPDVVDSVPQTIETDAAVAAAIGNVPIGTFAPGTAQAVAQSRKPNARPKNFARVVDKARKNSDANAEVTRVAAVAPRAVVPKIPSKSSVAKQATVRNAINLRKINLIGVYGKPSSRRALVRLSSGRYKKVKIGDRIDGGRISAIGDNELRYSKNGRSVVLRMPKG